MHPPLNEQRWQLPPSLGRLKPDSVEDLPAELMAVLERRGLGKPEQVRALMDPEAAPDPDQHFPDLPLAVQRLQGACERSEAVAICGDYDADGMTSTALLVGVLQRLGARPRAAIPSRMEEGYGLNVAMVERLAAERIMLLVTVDNGVAAREALERAAQLGIAVILTDHHSLPETLPPYLALLHPAMTPAESPYRGLAGVGLAHVLASALCRRMRHQDGQAIALDLFCLGTIADMAPLMGVNRRWLIDGLPRLGATRLPGLRALQRIAGVREGPLDAETVGFQLAPRINAVGRLGDPLMVVELLTTECDDQAIELARNCDGLNRQRRELCKAIEAEALALLEADGPCRPTFLLLAQNHWHHGVIGIVASRLVERFGRPVALLASQGDGMLRASVRAPQGFAVDKALQGVSSLLVRYGGHPAAGGFTVRAEHLSELHVRLDALASNWLQELGGGVCVEPEALLRLERIDGSLWRQLKRLEPFGVGHPAPVFWSSDCHVVESRLLRGGHLQLQLEQGEKRVRAMAWNWSGGIDLPQCVDVAYRLRLDRWHGEEQLQLELVGIRKGGGTEVVLQRRDRTYWCRRQGMAVVIRNAAGEEIRSQPDDEPAHPYLRALLSDASRALGMSA